MAELSAQNRRRIRVGLSRYWSRLWEQLGSMSKAELLAAVNATDTWIEDNQGSFNAALPLPARIELTTAQKTLVFYCVAAMRVSPAFARLLLGEVD